MIDVDASTHKLVVAVRKDLRLSRGKLAAQVAHAAVDCALKAKAAQSKVFTQWYREGQRKIIVEVVDRRALHALHVRCDELGLVSALVTDAGRTELKPGTVTVLGVGPGSNATVDRITGDLPLV